MTNINVQGCEDAVLFANRSFLFRHRAFRAMGLLVLTSACASVPTNGHVGPYRVRVSAPEPNSLNPLFDAMGLRFNQLLFEPLFRVGPNARLVPGLALETPTFANGGISRGGRRVTVRLRRGTLWSDGVPVTSADVKFACEQILNPQNPVKDRFGYDRLARVSVPDPQTVVFEFSRPEPAALSTIESSLAPLPVHLLAHRSNLNDVPYNAMPIGNGPYRLVSWKRGESIRLDANSRYWRGMPKIPHIEIRISGTLQNSLVQVQSRDVELSLISSAFAAQVPDVGIRRVISPGLTSHELMFNFARPILRERSLREAILLSIDRDRLATLAGHGLFTADRPALPIFNWATDPSVVLPAANAKAADRILNRAGWRVGADGLRHRGDRTLTLSMVYDSNGNPLSPQIVAEDLERLRIHVVQRHLPAEILYARAGEGGVLANGDFDLAMLGFDGDLDPIAPLFFGCDRRPPNGFNYGRYCNANVDADFVTAGSTLDRSVRRKAFADVQRRLVADVAFVPLYRHEYLWAVAQWLRGIAPSPYSEFWNVYAWSASP